MTVGLLQITAPHFLAGTPYASAPLVTAYFEKNDAGWIRAERDQWLARLAPMAQARTAASYPPAPPSASTTAPGPARPAQPVPFSTLPAADQALYASAVEAETRDARGAWKTALPLFETHPRVVEVQELRCRLAKLQHFFPGVAEAHCERLEGLTHTAAGPTR